MTLTDLKKIKLPDTPGVYLFKSGTKASSKILYIGKATSLKDRVRSYFSNDLIKTRGPLLVDMVTQSVTVDHTQTESVLEALILEASLIKKHQPLYNTKEKDNKSYNYIVVTKEDFPRILIERGRTLSFDTKKYKSVYGPFPSSNQLKEALRIIRKIFPFIGEKTQSHLNKQIGLEPDATEASAKKAYARNIRHIELFFKGKKKELLARLEKQMNQHAKKQEFEQAEIVKRQLFALTHIKDVSLIQEDRLAPTASIRIESYDIAHLQGTNSVGVMTVIEDGEIKKSDYRKFILRDTKKGDDIGGLKEIITRRFKHPEWSFPDVIVVDGGKTQLDHISKLITELKLTIPVLSVVKDEKHNPRDVLGDPRIAKEYKKDILLSNNEAHRFAITFFRKRSALRR